MKNKTLNMLFVVLIILGFTVSGYYTKRDINDMAYVVAIGIDVRRK